MPTLGFHNATLKHWVRGISEETHSTLWRAPSAIINATSQPLEILLFLAGSGTVKRDPTDFRALQALLQERITFTETLEEGVPHLRNNLGKQLTKTLVREIKRLFDAPA